MALVACCLPPENTGAGVSVASLSRRRFIVVSFENLTCAEKTIKSDSEYDVNVEAQKATSSKTTKKTTSSPAKKRKTSSSKDIRNKKSGYIDIFGLSGEDLEVEESKPTSLSPYIQNRVANGSQKRIASTDGDFYIELKVYNRDDAESSAPDERWKKALLRVSCCLENESSQWKNLQRFVKDNPPCEKDNVDVEDSGNHYDYGKNLRTALPQILAVSIKNLLLLGYGMTLGFPTILIPAVKNPIEGENIQLDNTGVSWIGSINLIVVPIGCALSGVVTSPMGRRRAMQMLNIPFFVAWLLFHFAQTPGQLYGALFLTGLTGGLLEAPVLTYVAEITQPHLRGALSATSSMCIIIGVFTQFLLGIFLYWRTIALVNISCTITAVIALFFVPESPHWLVSRKRHDEARKSLQWLRGWTEAKVVENELQDIQKIFEKDPAEIEDHSFIKNISFYTCRSFLVPYFLICYSFFVGHFSGMTTLQTYAVSIFQTLKAPIDKYYATLILGILQIVGSGVCVVFVHYIGKRPLALFSTAGAAVCCFLVAGYDIYIIKNQTSEATDEANNVSSSYAWIPTTLFMALALITHTGIRLLPWILIGEVFSAKTRSGGAGLAGAAGYILGFLTNKMYISMVDSLLIWGTYGLYGIISFTGCIVLYFILPETEGKTLTDIENHFSGVKKMNNQVYRCDKKYQSSGMSEMKGTTNPSFEDDTTKL